MRIKNLPSIESMNGSQDALVIEQTDGGEDKSRKVSPAQIKQFMEAGDFEATGEVKDGHGNTLKDIEEKSGVITLNSGWNFDGGVVNTVRKFGNVAWISSYIYSTNALTAGTLYNVGTLPTGFIPLKNCVIPIYGSDSSTLNGVVTIGTDGKIKYKAVNTGRYALYTTIMYPLS